MTHEEKIQFIYDFIEYFEDREYYMKRNEDWYVGPISEEKQQKLVEDFVKFSEENP